MSKPSLPILKSRYEIERDKFGPFFGDDIDDDALDQLVHEKVSHLSPEALGGLERQLYTTKWFDYRFMHFLRATYLFAHVYLETYKTMCRRHIDRSLSERVVGFSPADFLESEEKTALWRCRQHADALGIEYGFYLSHAMEAALRRRRKYIPRPNQLYSDRIKRVVASEWEEWTEETFVLAKDPRYQMGHSAGGQLRAEHERWALKLAKKGHREGRLSTALKHSMTVSREGVAAEFGNEMLEKALERD